MTAPYDWKADAVNVQPFLIGDGWLQMKDGDFSCRSIFDRHYSRHVYADGRKPRLFVGPGEKMVLMQADGSALCVWRRHKSDDGQVGINCAIFRNEGNSRASQLLVDAMRIAWRRWPSERLYTYVDPRFVKPTLFRGYPVFGFCFYKAGWKFCGISKKKSLHILEALI